MEISQHSTFLGVNKWYQHSATHFGWAIMALSRGDTEKVKVYVKSLDRLVKAIQELQKVYQSPDKIHDLQVLEYQAKVLQKASKQLLK